MRRWTEVKNKLRRSTRKRAASDSGIGTRPSLEMWQGMGQECSGVHVAVEKNGVGVSSVGGPKPVLDETYPSQGFSLTDEGDGGKRVRSRREKKKSKNKSGESSAASSSESRQRMDTGESAADTASEDDEGSRGVAGGAKQPVRDKDEMADYENDGVAPAQQTTVETSNGEDELIDALAMVGIPGPVWRLARRCLWGAFVFLAIFTLVYTGLLLAFRPGFAEGVVDLLNEARLTLGDYLKEMMEDEEWFGEVGKVEMRMVNLDTLEAMELFR